MTDRLQYIWFCVSSILTFACHVTPADFGPFDVLVHDYENCPDVPNPKIIVGIMEKKLNSTNKLYDINITNSIPIDHSLSSAFQFTEVSSRSKHKNSTVRREFPKFCVATRSYIPGIFNTIVRELRKASGEDLSNCQLAAGSRVIHNILFEDFRGELFPSVFWYKKYLIKVYVRKNRVNVGCTQVLLESIPRKTKQKKN